MLLADDTKSHDLGGAIVKQLLTTIMENKAHVFSDYFTGMRILDYLQEAKVFLTVLRISGIILLAFRPDKVSTS